MATRVAINGFGRIGRLVARAIMERPDCGLELVTINDLSDTKSNALLFGFDSTHGRYPGTVEVDGSDLIVDGNPVPHDLLRVLGIEALAQFLVNEIQEVYKLQGVKINDKHIEVIVRQMLQKVEIVDPGDTTFLVGEQVDRMEYDQINERMLLEDRRPVDPFVEAQKTDLREFISEGLSRTERLILILYYYEQMTMKEIGETLDLSESRVSQMHSAIVDRLRFRLKDRMVESEV